MISNILHSVVFGAIQIGDACNPNTNNPQNNFFGFPHWWKYIDKGEYDFFMKCKPKMNLIGDPKQILAIVLAGIDMLLYLAGIAAVIFILYGGVSYMLSDGSSDRAAAAKKRLINAIIGLIIALSAIVVVRFIGASFS